MEIPFEYRDGRVWVPIRINGEDLRAIFDTGADGTAVDSELAQRLGLRAEDGRKGSTVAGEVHLQKAGPVKIETGGYRFPLEEVMVLPLEAQMPGLQAILGFDVLRHACFTIDYAGQRLRLHALPAGERLRFVLEDDIRPTVWLETLGGRFLAHVDTGSAQGVSLPLAWVQANAPTLLHAETRREILGGALSARRFILDRIHLGSSGVERVPGEAVAAEGGSFADQNRLWANVGNAVLERFCLGVDGRERVAILGQRERP